MARVDDIENSLNDGKPIECYRFNYLDVDYRYTSSDNVFEITHQDGTKETFSPTFIKRGDSLKPGSADASSVSVQIFVPRTNSVALLFQGPPPEKPVTVEIFRFHSDDPTSFLRILVGKVSQVAYEGSEAELTITVESYMNKQIPRGLLQYYCNNAVFDHNCRLNKADWELNGFVDIESTVMYVRSTDIAKYPSGYFNGGVITMGSSQRTVLSHEGDKVTFKYPFNRDFMEARFNLLPGCDALFRTCATKFSNTDNFTGVPYTPPTDSEKNPTGKGTYWIDSLIITRDSNCEIGTISGIP